MKEVDYAKDLCVKMFQVARRVCGKLETEWVWCVPERGEWWRWRGR